jgi:hypothetical protein
MSKSFEIVDYARYRKCVTNSVLEELHTGELIQGLAAATNHVAVRSRERAS